MQPLKTAVRPSSLSTIGWPPAVDRSMTDSRRWPKATRPALQDPCPSGPRGTRAQTIRSTAAVSAREPSKVISPERPHMQSDLTRWRGGMPPDDRSHSCSTWNAGPPGPLQGGPSSGGEAGDGGHDVDQPGALVERGRVAADRLVRRPVGVAVRAALQRRLDLRGGRGRVGLEELGDDAGDVRGRHRGTADRVEGADVQRAGTVLRRQTGGADRQVEPAGAGDVPTG